MLPNRRVLAILVAVLTLAANALAQKNEISGLIGRTFIPTQSITGATWENPNLHFGNGLSLEGNYSRHLRGEGFLMLRFEVPVVYNIKEKLNTGANVIPESYSSLFVTPSLRANIFSDTAFSPWVSFGGESGRLRQYRSPADGSRARRQGPWSVGHSPGRARLLVRPPTVTRRNESRPSTQFLRGRRRYLAVLEGLRFDRSSSSISP
jgi:hypothetical protein